jgi:hypothetical protein
MPVRKAEHVDRQRAAVVKTLMPTGLAGHMGHVDRTPLWAKPVLVVGPVSLKEIGPLLLLFSFTFYFNSL